MEGAYYVASDEDGPELIYFSSDEAFASGYTFIDIFDDDGDKLASFKLNIDDDYNQDTCEDDYTTNF